MIMNIMEIYSRFKECGQVTTDTRTLKGGEMFFALKGENFDGNDYAAKALDAGAACVVVNESSDFGKKVAAGEYGVHEGKVILVEAQVSYSELYGLTVVINDIDPEYSVGVKELERQKTIERLQKEGLMGLQSELSLPALPYRLAVISAEDAAGYRDFMRHLHENPYGFVFATDLFPALMQGASAPGSIIAALDAIMECGTEYDAVLVLRGGGSKLDLSCFDDYDLAAAIAQYPLPVLTAVGHDQDHHVADMVAYEYVKTPTALADFFLEIYEDEDARLSSYLTRMRLAFTNRIALMESALNVLQARIAGADPRRILERGYALALDGSGKVMKGTAGRSKGDRMSVMFADGTLDCVVEGIRKR